MTAVAATELWRMSATELAEAIRTRQVSSAGVVEAHLRRIEAVNPAINAIVIVLGEQALQAAEAADRAQAAGANLRPFHGVPFTIKDIIDVAGTPTTQGFKALAGASTATRLPGCSPGGSGRGVLEADPSGRRSLRKLAVSRRDRAPTSACRQVNAGILI